MKRISKGFDSNFEANKGKIRIKSEGCCKRLAGYGFEGPYTTAQVAAEHGCEHVTVGERRLGGAALAEVLVNDRAGPAVVKLVKNREKSPRKG